MRLIAYWAMAIFRAIRTKLKRKQKYKSQVSTEFTGAVITMVDGVKYQMDKDGAFIIIDKGDDHE